MIAFPEMLVGPAEKAGISVPEDLDNYDKEAYPKWFIYSILQLGASMPSPTSHWTNAKVVAGLSDTETKTITFKQLQEMGLETGFPIL